MKSKEIRWLPKAYYKQKHLVLKYESKDPLYLVTNLESPDRALEIYGRQMAIEEGFKDFKDGMRLKILRVNHVQTQGQIKGIKSGEDSA